MLSVLRLFRHSWPQLALTGFLAKVFGVVLLLPLTALLLRGFTTFKAGGVLTDEEILHYFLSPWGLVTFLVVGSVTAGITFAEQASMMTLVIEPVRGGSTTYREALKRVGRIAPRIVELAGRMLLAILGRSAPFLAVPGFLYLVFLTDYDVNYYLTQRPPTFWVVTVLGGVALLILAAVLGRLFLSWMFALPGLIAHDLDASEALRQSLTRTQGRKLQVAAWLLAWLGLGLAASAVLTAAAGGLGRLVAPPLMPSLVSTAAALAAVILLGALLNAVGSFLHGAFFATLVVALYREAGGLPGGGGAWSPPPGTRTGARRLRVSARSWILAGCLAALATLTMTVALLHGIRVEDKVTVTAHRGASSVAPENTLAAVGEAIAQGADWVEIDVQETADGMVVVAHDRDLMRTAGVGVRVRETLYRDLAGIDVGSWFAPRFSGETIPTLGQVLERCKGRVGVIIELKSYETGGALEERVISEVERWGMEADVAVMSLKREATEKVRRLRPAWRVGLLAAVAVGDLTRLDADFLAVNSSLASGSFVRSAHRRGKEVHVWTVNDPVQMSSLMSIGVDNLITDRPDLARRVLGERADMSPLERLLIRVAGAAEILPEPRSSTENEA